MSNQPHPSTPDDAELLASFSRDRSAQAFRELVNRHLPAVHAAAARILRHTTPPLTHYADDIAQSVFILLAQKATKIPTTTPLVGWLYQVTHYACTNLKRMERNRRRHEQETAAMRPAETLPKSVSEAEAYLDTALLSLSARDRNILLLRYISNYSLTEISRNARIPEETAKKRLHRAIEKLRHYFAKRGMLAAAPAALHALAPTSPISAAIASTITNTALASASTGAASTSYVIAKGVAHMIKIATLLKTGAAATVFVAAVIASTVLVHNVTSAPAPIAQAPTTLPVPANPTLLPEPYLLREHEAFKYIADPPAVARDQVLKCVMAKGMGSGAPNLPTALILYPKAGILDDNIGYRWKFDGPYTLSDILELSLEAYPQEVEGNTENPSLAGDWVCDLQMPLEDRRSAIEKVLQNDLHKPLRLAYRDVPREVIVFKGTWKYASPQPRRLKALNIPFLEIYETLIKNTLSSGVYTGNSRGLEQGFGKYLHQQVIIEGQALPDSLIWDFNDWDHDPKSVPANPALVLDHLTEQTGLTWSKETRTVRRLFLAPTTAATAAAEKRKSLLEDVQEALNIVPATNDIREPFLKAITEYKKKELSDASLDALVAAITKGDRANTLNTVVIEKTNLLNRQVVEESPDWAYGASPDQYNFIRSSFKTASG